jgi:CRISPR-associated protein Cmr4
MYQKAKLMFLHCETSLHAGAGTGVGRIDLPIQRESHTGFPKIESSGLKGSIREVFEEKLQHINGEAHPDVSMLFGHENSENSGSLGFTDARILLFPVRSTSGIFAWVTCPRVLWQLKKDYALLMNGGMQLSGDSSPEENRIKVPDLLNPIVAKGQVMLEEFVFNADKLDLKIKTGSKEKGIADWMADQLFDNGDEFGKLLPTHFAIVHDQVFNHFVNLFTEVVTRNRIDNETGIVISGALFTEEYLPANSVLYSLVLSSPQFSKPGEGQNRLKADEVMKKFEVTFPANTYFQAGGNATIGKGILKARFHS